MNGCGPNVMRLLQVTHDMIAGLVFHSKRLALISTRVIASALTQLTLHSLVQVSGIELLENLHTSPTVCHLSDAAMQHCG